ncbi:MAG TPA: cation:proton antiporter [Gemmatimonadaceae bacterium]|nr:cation:proton antiporter [Gemmatimonadaceae bacterium]
MVVASLLSAVVERVGIPLVAAFLLLGAVLGPYGFGLIDMHLASPVLRALAILGLALVLFSDAVTVNVRELRDRRQLVWMVLGPGTLLPAALIALAAFWVLDLSAAAAAILGAALASTDPVLLRSVLRSPSLPTPSRVALRIESGMNDALLVPIVILAALALREAAPLSGREIGRNLVGLFVLGPALGAIVGWAGITMLASVRSRVGVRRDYESLYALGLGFAAYAAAEAVGGSGFLAAFAAGLAIAALDVELCDCFLEYGEATSEMLLLLTFVAFGASLIWTGLSIVDWRLLVFTPIALLARTAVLYPVLTHVGVRGQDRKYIALFGPRGLSSLLLALLPVFAGVPGASRLFSITSFVVLVSLAAHGGIIGYYLRSKGAPRQPRQAPRVVEPSEAKLEQPEPENEHIITQAEVLELQRHREPVIFIDARAPRSFEADNRRIRGALRIQPDDPVRMATDLRLSNQATLVVYCA